MTEEHEPTTDLDAARAFFRTLYPDPIAGGVGIVALREKRGRGSVAVSVRRVPLDANDRADRLAAAAAALEALNVRRMGAGKGPGAVYAVLAARRAGATSGRRHGGGATLAAVTALWCEADMGTAGHAADGLPPDVDSALDLLAAMDAPRPSMVVHSGGGLHAYWILEAPIMGPGARDTLAHRAFRAWGDRLEAAGARTGYTVDRMPCEPVRMLRVPGAGNWKTGTRRPVRILERDPTARYALTALTPDLDLEMPPAPSTRQRNAGPSGRRNAALAGPLPERAAVSSPAALAAFARLCDQLRQLRPGERHAPTLSLIPPVSGRLDLALADGEAVGALQDAARAGGMAADDLGTVADAWFFGRAAPYMPKRPGSPDGPPDGTGGPPCAGWLENHTTHEALESIPPRQRARTVIALRALHGQAAALDVGTVFMGRRALSRLTGMGARTAAEALANVAELPFVRRHDPPAQARQGGGRFGRARRAPAWELMGDTCHTVSGEHCGAHLGRCATCAHKSPGRPVIIDAPSQCAAAIHPRTAEPSPTLAAILAPLSGRPRAVRRVLERAAGAGDVAAARLALPEDIARGVALGTMARTLRAVAGAGGPVTGKDVAALRGCQPKTARAHGAALEALGLLAGAPMASTGGRPARAWTMTDLGRAALSSLPPCEALTIRRGREADAAIRAGASRVGRPDTRAGLDDATAADAAALRAERRRGRCHPPAAPRVPRHAPTIAPSPADVDDALERAAARVPDVPAWLESMGAAMDAADGWPPAVTVDAPPMPTVGAVLAAAAALGTEVVDRDPMPRPGAPPPALELPAPGELSPAMLEAIRADAPPPDTSWQCRCGSRSTQGACWNCGTPRERGERPSLAILAGRAVPVPVDPERAAALAALAPDAATLEDAAAIRRRADTRPALTVLDGRP